MEMKTEFIHGGSCGKKMLPAGFGGQNRRFTAYALKCLVIIYMAAKAAALQSIFAPLSPLPHFFTTGSGCIKSVLLFLYRESLLGCEDKKV